jgi:thiol-disulfide isomerase/thioredoxin
MKVLFTNLVLFIVLSFAFSALTSCTNTQTASLDNVNAPANSADAPPEKKKVNYPPAPSAIMTADIKKLDGTTFKLQDKKGKVILLNAWATWCGPCIAEMPHLIEMQDKFASKGFEIIGLDSDNEPKDAIEAFVGKQKLNYQIAWADEAFMTEMIKVSRLSGIPQSLLINREGQLTGVFTGGGASTVNKMKETVEKIVNE